MATVESGGSAGDFTLTLSDDERQALQRETLHREDGTTEGDVLERVVTGQLNIFLVHQSDKRAARLETEYAALSVSDKAKADVLMPGVDDVD